MQRIRLPNAPVNYDAKNEAQFRAMVARALEDTFHQANSRIVAGTGFPTSIQGWVHTLAFSAVDNDTVQWGAGTITLTDGTAYSIGAANTGNMTTVNYIYLDIGTSTTALQVTETVTDAVGTNKILVAVAQDVAAGSDALFQVFGGADAQKLALVTADVMAADTVTANEIAANTITAAEIAAGTITANEIAAGTITATEIAAGTITASRIATGTITANEIAANTITANEIAATTITGAEIASLNISTKSITADTGTVGGWTLSANALSSGSVSINATTERLLMGAASAPLTGTGVFLGLDGADYEFRAGNPAGPYIHWDGSALTVSGATLSEPGIGTSPSLLGWNHNMAFSAVDYDTVQWGAGTIELSNGVTYSIDAGNTGNMLDVTYIYLDTDVGTTFLNTSTAPGDSMGVNRILVAVAQDAADSAKDALFQVFGGPDPQKLNLITADVIAANTITANEIFGNTLSAISADMGTLTAGSIEIGTTNKIWLNDAADGALNIGGATKASAPFRVTSAGALTATSATVTGTITSGSTIAANSFTGTAPVFDEAVTVEAGASAERVVLDATGSAGRVLFYHNVSPANGAGWVGGYATGYGSDLGLVLVSVDQWMNFRDNTGTPNPAWTLNNGKYWGSHSTNTTQQGTGASTAYVSLHTRTWPAGDQFGGGYCVFWGSITGTSDVKNVRIVVDGVGRLAFQAAAGDTGSWCVRVHVLPPSGTTQELMMESIAPDGTASVTRFSENITLSSTALAIELQGQTANAADEITCYCSYAYSFMDAGIA